MPLSFVISRSHEYPATVNLFDSAQLIFKGTFLNVTIPKREIFILFQNKIGKKKK